MNAAWRVLTLLSVAAHAASRCAPTSYYKNCWIRRFPGIYIDVEASLRRDAQLLRFYREDTALTCSRTCCVTRNFSCNLAIFHYDATQESVNCFHLHCPTLESCILSHRRNVVLYNVTKGVDPDLLVFGKYFNSNVRVLPHHYSRSNASDPLPPDKRQFIHPRPRPRPVPPAPVSTEVSTATRTAVSRGESPNAATSSTERSTVKTTAHSGIDVSNMATRTESEIKHSNMETSAHLESPFHSTTIPPTISTTASTFKTQASSTFQTSLSRTFPAPLSSSAVSETPPKSTTSGSPAMSSSKHHTNDTKWGEDGQSGAGGDPWGDGGPGWRAAPHTVLVAVAVCVTVLLGCCCSAALVFSWRGHRKRMGRYRTAWRGRRRSMRLIKYVLVKENS